MLVQDHDFRTSTFLVLTDLLSRHEQTGMYIFGPFLVLLSTVLTHHSMVGL